VQYVADASVGTKTLSPLPRLGSWEDPFPGLTPWANFIPPLRGWPVWYFARLIQGQDLFPNSAMVSALGSTKATFYESRLHRDWEVLPSDLKLET